MSPSKKKGADRQSVEPTPSTKTIDYGLGWQWSWGRFIIVAVVVVLMAVIIGVFYYQYNIAPFRRTIITVDDTTIDTGYFIKRTRLAGADPMTMLNSLTNEQLIKLVAPRYVGEVSPEDIDQGLRSAARGGSETISENEFKEWYRQQLNESGLSDAEYKEITRLSLLASRLQAYFAERAPTVAEQVHLNIIVLETYGEAAKTRARWEAGEDFADLAREVSLDEGAKENGGDFGWVPRGVLPPVLDYIAFSLNTDNVSEPVDLSDPSLDPGQTAEPEVVYFLLMVSEKADAREVAEDYQPRLQDKTFQDWLGQEMALHNIRYNFNSEIYAWINWQLSKSTSGSSDQK